MQARMEGGPAPSAGSMFGHIVCLAIPFGAVATGIALCLSKEDAAGGGGSLAVAFIPAFIFFGGLCCCSCCALLAVSGGPMPEGEEDERQRGECPSLCNHFVREAPLSGERHRHPSSDHGSDSVGRAAR
eukprot:gene27980-59853_t